MKSSFAHLRVSSEYSIFKGLLSVEKLVEKAKSDARSEAENILAQARSSIENEKRAAMNEIKNQVADLSIGIASKVLDQELNKDKNHQEYIDKLLNEKKFN